MPGRRSTNKFDSTYVNKKWKNKQSSRYRCGSFAYGGWWTPPTGGGKASKAARKDKSKEIRQYNESIMKMQYDDYLQWFDGEIYAYSDPSDDTDHDGEWHYINYDDIPIWNCTICSYKNIQRLSYCSFCNHPYTHETTANGNTTKPKQPLRANITNNSPKIHSLSRETSDSEIYKYYHDKLMLKLKLIRMKRKLLNLLLPPNNLDILHSNINHLRVRCVINDHWLKKINLKHVNDGNIIYIKRPIDWYSIGERLLSKPSSHLLDFDVKYKQIMNDSLKYNAMVKMCDIHSFINIFLTRHDCTRFVPLDVLQLCVLFCGIVPQLLPFASNCVDYVSASRFQSFSFNKFKYTKNVYEASHWLYRSTEYEIFVAIIIGNMNHIAAGSINYADFLPIFSLELMSRSRTKPRETEWVGWLKQFETKDHVKVSNIIHTDHVIKSISKYASSCNTERYGSIHDESILKYVKKGDTQRYLRRKWSAYSKL
eukprot:355644_1